MSLPGGTLLCFAFAAYDASPDLDSRRSPPPKQTFLCNVPVEIRTIGDRSCSTKFLHANLVRLRAVLAEQENRQLECASFSRRLLLHIGIAELQIRYSFSKFAFFARRVFHLTRLYFCILFCLWLIGERRERLVSYVPYHGRQFPFFCLKIPDFWHFFSACCLKYPCIFPLIV